MLTRYQPKPGGQFSTALELACVANAASNAVAATGPPPRSPPAAVLVRRCERVVRCVAHSADSGHRASVAAQPFRQAFRETVRLGGYPDLPVGLARQGLTKTADSLCHHDPILAQ